ncbi:MAG: hypothetical protein NT042_15385 [Sulfuritalea sp.]|nr:hypothetical protein [Sulfuritalea sp.]
MDTEAVSHALLKGGNSIEFLTFKEAHDQYPGSPKPTTLSVWSCTKRYPEFSEIVTYIGGRRVLRRDKWEALLSRGFGEKQRKQLQFAA